MTINFSPGFKEVWNENTLRMRLYDLSNAKNDTWIHTNLTVTESNWASRCLFSLVGKRFACLRKLYFINPSHSANSLERLGVLVAKHPDPELYALFSRAASNFAFITNHSVRYPEWSLRPEQPFASEACATQTPITSQETAFVQTSSPQLVAVEPVTEPLIMHEVHQHYHVSTPPVIVDRGRPPLHVVHHVTPGYVAPRHIPIPHGAVNRVPVAVTAERNIVPGTGRREPQRNAAPSLAAQNVRLASQAKVVGLRPSTPAVVPPQAAKRMNLGPTRTEAVRHASPPVRHTPVARGPGGNLGRGRVQAGDRR